MFRDLHSCDHRLRGLLCFQPGDKLYGVELQQACEGDAGKRDLNNCSGSFQAKAGDLPKIQNAKPRADQGLKVIIDRNFNR